MNKREKRIQIIIALSMAIGHSMSLHPEYNREYCENGGNPFSCYNDNGHCSCYGDISVNDSNFDCSVAEFLIRFIDYDGNILASNFLAESYQTDGRRRWPCLSKLINKISSEEDIDINHLMDGKADLLLHKVRYVEISLGRAVYDNNGDYSYTIEDGIKYNLFNGRFRKYNNRKIKYDENGAHYLD